MSEGNVLDLILGFHKDPKSFILTGGVDGEEWNLKIIGKFIEEDNEAWYIKHNGEYIFWCRKELSHGSMHNRAGLPALEIGIQELWGRYTNKQMAPFIYSGVKV